MAAHIGTSGWHYQHWKGGFYPPGLPMRGWLQHYSERFETVEVNNAFYRLPERSVFERWGDELPADFVVAVKASRYLTHIRRLKVPESPVQLLMDRAAGLGGKLGPVLLQLPPNLRADPPALDRALAAFPDTVKVAVEFRHETWFSDETRQVLEQRKAALCLADGGPVQTPLWRAADWGYLRFHRGRARPESCYGRTALTNWAHRLADTWDAGEELYVYFNNDLHGCALRDAVTFASAARRVGLVPSAVPARRELGSFT